MCKFCHLHFHSAYSEDAVNSPYVLCKTAKSMGMTALTLTEHGSMASAVEFAAAAKMNDIKAISGCEFYISVDGVTCHITALGDGKNGYNNLVRILNNGVNRAYNLGKTSKRTVISIDDLIQYNEGVVLLTGCPNSPMQAKTSGLDDATNLLNKLKNTYGDRMFVEMMLAGESESSNLLFSSMERSLLLSELTNTPLVVTNDGHYARPEDRAAHQFIMKSVGYTYGDEDLYMKSYDELVVRASDFFKGNDLTRIIHGIEMSQTIADKLEGLEFNAKPQLPFIADADNKLYESAHTGLEKRAIENNWDNDRKEKATKALDFELGVLKDKEFSTYILLTSEFLDVGRQHGMVGYGRGSAAGSMVCYALAITEVDPIEADTLFERFINPYRHSFPDIDSDSSEKARDAIIKYAEREYGAIPIATYSVHSHKSLINDLARIYAMPEDLVKRLREDEPTKDKSGKNVYLDIEAWEIFANDYEEASKAYYSCLNQNIRHGGKHAAGIILTPETIDYEIPLTLRDGVILAEYSEGTHGQNLAGAGGVKMDELGLKTLDVVERVSKITGEKIVLPKRYDYLPEIAAIDESTMELDGVFQLSGETALNYAKKFNPTTLEDVVLITSLARTGNIMSGASDEFLKHRKISGSPRVRAIPPYDKGDKVKIRLDNGLVKTYFSHWQIMLVDGTFKEVRDLVSGDEVYEER